MWSRAMSTDLRAKSKLQFIEGTIEKRQRKTPPWERWDVCNSHVIVWIFNTVEEDIQ
ncbi:hypothetical protein CDL15_Pgr014179 [Punica granatum]|nr:hypothetical protein CDL15_Pgr014179 [Punica granatum]